MALSTAPSQVSIRQFLRDRGYKDEEIGYDPSRKVVTLQGKDFTPAAAQNGRTFDTAQNLTGALSTFDRLRSRAETEQRRGTINELVTRLRQRAEQPARAFAYDPNTDPQYQAAVRTATENARIGNNANMAEMNRRNILNSTITSDRGARIQQQEMGRVTTDVLPQLMQQAYGRFTNEQNQEQTQHQNLVNLISTLSGLNQDSQNTERDLAESDRLRQEGEAKATADAEKAALDNLWKAAEQTGSLPNELADFYGLPHGTKTLDAEKVGISRINAQTQARGASTSAGNLELSRAKFQNEQDENTLQSQVIDGITAFDNAQEASAWLNANAAAITQNLGADTFTELKNMLPLFFGEDTSAADAKAKAEADKAATSAAAKTRSEAVSMAQKDVRWNDSKTNKEALIQEYVQLISGPTPIPQYGYSQVQR